MEPTRVGSDIGLTNGGVKSMETRVTEILLEN